MEWFIEALKAIVFGVVEGVTEWLPISSTGHLILVRELIRFDFSPLPHAAFEAEYWNMFEVVIQLGAILAVVVKFFRRLNPFSPSKSTVEKKSTWLMWLKIVVASIPAAFVGLVLDKVIEKLTGKDIDGWIYNWQVVAAALVVYGIAFIIIEKYQSGKPERVKDVGEIGYGEAFLIGIFQMLAIIPGTSRSGSTVLGSRLFGISRLAAAEFSFFLAIPSMAGASLLKMLGFFEYVIEESVSIPASAWINLALAFAVAFAVSMIAINFLVDFVKRHTFSAFGVYRIVLGVLVTAYFLIAR